MIGLAKARPSVLSVMDTRSVPRVVPLFSRLSQVLYDVVLGARPTALR